MSSAGRNLSAPREITPLPAATVTLVRDGAHGLEVLMLQRNFRSGFMPGAYLFPGGAVDEDDNSIEINTLCVGIDDRTASGLLRLEHGGLAYWVAAIREAFEEAGALYAYDPGGELPRRTDAQAAARLDEHRRALNAGSRLFLDVLRDQQLRLAADRLVYFSHWITPVGAPRRYDTRFFVAAAPEEQALLHDDVETIAHLWIAPGAALSRHRAGEFRMRTPTVHTLKQFADYDSADRLIAALRTPRDIPAMLPRIRPDGTRVLPGDPGYEDAAEARTQGKWET